MRIAYCVDGMYNSAGMERVLSEVANALCFDHDITFITRRQEGKPFHFKIDNRIKHIDLNATNKQECKYALEQVLMREKFDIVISNGGLDMYCLYKIKDGSKKIFQFHFSYDIAKVWVGNKWMGIPAKLQTWRRIWIAKHYDHVVVLCKTDMKKWKQHIRTVTCIYNPLTINSDYTTTCMTKNVIAVGRLHVQKGFDMLIDAWSIVSQKHSDWKLNIFGEGEERFFLQNRINDHKLSQSVSLCGKTNDIINKYLDSSIFVLSSRDEAFGLVITEAEACGLPIVTFDCPSAPAEIVENGKNGYVVPLGDIKAMSDKICVLIENENLRREMGSQSKLLSERFHIDIIKEQWNNLFRQIINIK